MSDVFTIKVTFPDAETVSIDFDTWDINIPTEYLVKSIKDFVSTLVGEDHLVSIKCDEKDNTILIDTNKYLKFNMIDLIRQYIGSLFTVVKVVNRNK